MGKYITPEERVYHLVYYIDISQLLVPINGTG